MFHRGEKVCAELLHVVLSAVLHRKGHLQREHYFILVTVGVCTVAHKVKQWFVGKFNPLLTQLPQPLCNQYYNYLTNLEGLTLLPDLVSYPELNTAIMV